MLVASTRGRSEKLDFKEAVFRGLAPDGGLYLPVVQPDLGPALASLSPDSTMSDIARAAMRVFLADELDGESIDRVAVNAFSFQPELKRLDEGLYLLELFHGPTLAFKDFGACFLAALMEEYLRRDRRRAVILTATSGDTGSAVASAFHDRAGIQVVILYPSGRVSPLQEKQLTTLGGNVAALEVEGSFDDCQRMVKAAFTDAALGGRLGLTSANSINLGRLVPQAFYYIYGRLRLQAERPGGCVFCVPSGNFGNLTAGVLAWRWGLAVDGFLAATNANKVVPEYLESGVFKPRPSVHTLSNAMDVGDPSNFERLEAIFGGDAAAMRAAIQGVWVSDDETRDAIRRWRRERGLFLDPHTALGVHAAERRLATGRDRAVIALGTAHPGKFREVVRAATGEEPPLPERLARVLALEKKSIRMPNDSDALKSWLLSSFA